jgi:hypothetical protein
MKNEKIYFDMDDFIQDIQVDEEKVKKIYTYKELKNILEKNKFYSLINCHTGKVLIVFFTGDLFIYFDDELKRLYCKSYLNCDYMIQKQLKLKRMVFE